jgi:hypothetical protein
MNRPREYFTVETANATLPLVRRIVDDLMTLHPEWRAAVTAYELAQDGANSTEESEEARAARLEVGRLAGEIETCLDELEQVGCHFRDFDLGLVDFPARRDERVVSLCWHRAEPAVSHWHELTTGFAGRHPLDEAFTVRGAE